MAAEARAWAAEPKLSLHGERQLMRQQEAGLHAEPLADRGLFGALPPEPFPHVLRFLGQYAGRRLVAPRPRPFTTQARYVLVPRTCAHRGGTEQCGRVQLQAILLGQARNPVSHRAAP